MFGTARGGVWWAWSARRPAPGVFLCTYENNWTPAWGSDKAGLPSLQLRMGWRPCLPIHQRACNELSDLNLEPLGIYRAIRAQRAPVRLAHPSAPALAVCAVAPKRQTVRMGNKATNGPFAPLVRVVRNIVGEKEFNKLRGKAISLHSQGELTVSPHAASLPSCLEPEVLVGNWNAKVQLHEVDQRLRRTLSFCGCPMPEQPSIFKRRKVQHVQDLSNLCVQSSIVCCTLRSTASCSVGVGACVRAGVGVGVGVWMCGCVRTQPTHTGHASVCVSVHARQPHCLPPYSYPVALCAVHMCADDTCTDSYMFSVHACCIVNVLVQFSA